jgi:hypothetical protein
MVKSGLPDNVILNKIGSGANPPKLSVDDVISLRSAGVSDGVVHALVVRGWAALRPVVGSGLEYHSTSAGQDSTVAFVIVGQEADGYWKETRVRIKANDTAKKEINFVSKELMVGDPPEPMRRIAEVDGRRLREVPVSASGGRKHGADIALFFLNALAGALDTFQADVEQRQLEGISRGHWPAQPIFPTQPNTSEGTSGAVVSQPAPTATSQSGGGTGGGWATWVINAVKVGAESIRVPAGTFECDHYTSDSNGKPTEVWTSSKVSSSLSPYGVVKLTSADQSVELQKVLEHETSQIEGEPKKMK